MAELPRTVTPVSAQVATPLMVVALSDREPEATRARVAQHFLSLVWIETGGGRSMIQNNWGNLAGEQAGNYWRPPWFEVTDSSSARNRFLHQEMLQGRAPSKFKAYPSRGEGLEAFVDLLYRPGYKRMLEAARANDTRAFADAVHDTGYCPDDACRGERTIDSYRKLTAKFAPLLGLPVPSTSIIPTGGAELGKGLGALVVLWALAKGLRR